MASTVQVQFGHAEALARTPTAPSNRIRTLRKSAEECYYQANESRIT
jgi:hypothetical protein